jgi:hypothetical protein
MSKIKSFIKRLFINKYTKAFAHHIIIKLSKIFGFNAILILEMTQGHYKSNRDWICLDGKGDFIPWFTYPCIEFLNQIDWSEKEVFEYGSGYSSLYFASKSKSLISIEDKLEWYSKIKNYSIKNHNILHIENQEAYVHSISKFDKKFDAIIIDAAHRLDCAKIVVSYLKEDGFIIFDNSNWYLEACEILRGKGFKQIDFHGFGSINQYSWTTSIFIMQQSNLNCINNIQPNQPINLS